MTDLETYLSRAAEARSAASEATLANVRDRCLRAETAWMQMAERLQRLEVMRARQVEEKQRVAAAASEEAP
jgi:hypothetical protein